MWYVAGFFVVVVSIAIPAACAFMLLLSMGALPRCVSDKFFEIVDRINK